MPKRALVTGLVSAFEGDRLKVAKGLPYGEALVRELRAFRTAVTSPGRRTYGGIGEHDDLVVAVALATLRGA